MARARGLFDGCEAAIASAPAGCGPGIRIACAAYALVLDQIETVDYDVLRRRTAAPRWRVAVSTFGAVRP